jgi:cyclopropane-fatty-acyl-phospholipid synthase
MSETTCERTIGTGVKPGGWYQTLVLQALGRMTLGHLHMTLPCGGTFVVGTPGAELAAVVRVRHADFFKKCVLFGDVGFGESYMDGDWDTDSLERVIAWAVTNLETNPAFASAPGRLPLLNFLQSINRFKHWLRPNSVETSRRNISDHYDLGNGFYRLWLDPTMTYSSAYFTNSGQSLEEAQRAKYEALCRKVKLKAGDHLLEIGSGWGGFSVHAAKNYGCRITTVTISEEQYRYAKERFQREGVADRVEILLKDYRAVEGQFDKVVSIEMMEAIGDRYLEVYCAKLHEVLKPEGLVGLQYITVPDCRHADLRRGVDFIQKHIFPGSLLLSIGRVNEAMNRTGTLFLHGLEDIGSSYARTLHLWWETFNLRVEEVRAQGFDERFVRKWNYYLQYCEAAFATRNISVVQAVYTRPHNRLLHDAF